VGRIVVRREFRAGVLLGRDRCGVGGRIPIALSVNPSGVAVRSEYEPDGDEDFAAGRRTGRIGEFELEAMPGLARGWIKPVAAQITTEVDRVLHSVDRERAMHAGRWRTV